MTSFSERRAGDDWLGVLFLSYANIAGILA